MKTNPILKEIRETRDRLSAEAGGDLGRLFEMIREREAAAKARGVVFVPVPQRPPVLPEEPASYGAPGKEAAP